MPVLEGAAVECNLERELHRLNPKPKTQNPKPKLKPSKICTKVFFLKN